MCAQMIACSCTACPGATCTCGCQDKNRAARKAGCQCGPECACGPNCTCATH